MNKHRIDTTKSDMYNIFFNGVWITLVCNFMIIGLKEMNSRVFKKVE
jgi:hypothetical protein